MTQNNQFLNTIRVGTLNCRGLNKYYKRMSIFDFLMKSNLDIIFLQETKLKPEEESQYIREWHNQNCIFNSVSGGKSGTAILVNNNSITMLHNQIRDVEGKVIAIDIKVGGTILHLVNSYGPNEYQAKIPFLNRLYTYLSSSKSIIWAGDHNIATDPTLDRYPCHFSHDHGSKEFCDIVRTFDLKDTCRVIYPSCQYFTYRCETSKAKSRIDKICVSSDFIVDKYEQLNLIDFNRHINRDRQHRR